MATWTMQHEDGSQIAVESKDERGLLLAKQCGYVWVNRNDGAGWRQVNYAIRDLRWALAVAKAA